MESKELFVHLFHIIIVGGLFLYVGIMKTSIYNFVYYILLVLGIIIIIYHVYKSIIAPQRKWINYIHIFIVGPLLIYIGYNKNNTSRKFFEILLMLAFSAIGYHLYYLFES
jgi:hypothetical protein